MNFLINEKIKDLLSMYCKFYDLPQHIIIKYIGNDFY